MLYAVTYLRFHKYFQDFRAASWPSADEWWKDDVVDADEVESSPDKLNDDNASKDRKFSMGDKVAYDVDWNSGVLQRPSYDVGGL